MPLSALLARRIRELRKAHDLTQEELARLMRTDVKWMQKTEAGNRGVQGTTVDRIADVFTLSISELLGAEFPEGSKLRARRMPAPHRQRKRKAT